MENIIEYRILAKIGYTFLVYTTLYNAYTFAQQIYGCAQ